MFTDIEGSTQLWERHPDSMTAALSRHDSVLEDGVSRFGGKIIAHGGDGIFATFEGGQPLECALSVQRQFQQEDWGEVEELRIRVGLHFGSTEVRGANHSGPVVNRSARVMASGWGGQVLVTPEVTNIHSLPDGASINDLGTHLLKDLSEPQQIFGLVHPDLRMTEFPPLRTLSSQPNNLPAQTTPFVGRESELAQTSTLLEDPQTRLLTLTGPGGIGKTRLSIQVASENSDQFRDGVWFVPLAPLDSTDLIVSTIAESLRFSFYNPQDLKAQLLNYLKEKQILLVIDNLEHLMTGADLIAEILQGAPDAKMMVTSRERLNLRGEQIVDVEGLDVPTNGHIEDVDSYAAIQLFVQGASRAQPGYALSGEDIQSAGQICRMVGGLPLGIELASAWTRVLTCQEIASEIEQSIDFLGGTLRDLPERQRSLRAVVDYSWEMLTDTEQTAFMSMAVFSGGFTREAAQQVSGASLMTLTSLQDKSLLRFNSARRYEFQPVLQQYAEDKFRKSQEEFDRVQSAHAEYYSSFLQARSDPILAQEETVLAEIGTEIENVRSAWQWAVEHKSFEHLARSVDALFIFYQIRGWYEEGNQVFSSAIEMMRGNVDSGPEQETTSGKILACQGAFQLRLGVPAKARELLEESRD
ncbi:MAG: NB-ARC domain-containing protein, partial [SAR202 cluster bacterium]|nr:NB-ARC domain-containing protein [SAR202 cluster bacterium]